VTPFTVADVAALGWFIACWVGYTIFADYKRAPVGLMGAIGKHRLAWMERMLERENRVMDTTLVGTMSNSVAFFAHERAREVIAELPLVAATAAVLWDAKVALLIVIFVFAFFKFTWSLRQFNYLLVLIGAAPLSDRLGRAEGEPYARRAARMGDLAVNHFNVGVRAYYFGLAALAWFINPWLFMAASAWVVLVLWRREFRSNTLVALNS
jgi:uncharacterized membrane protein